MPVMDSAALGSSRSGTRQHVPFEEPHVNVQRSSKSARRAKPAGSSSDASLSSGRERRREGKQKMLARIRDLEQQLAQAQAETADQGRQLADCRMQLQFQHQLVLELTADRRLPPTAMFDLYDYSEGETGSDRDTMSASVGTQTDISVEHWQQDRFVNAADLPAPTAFSMTSSSTSALPSRMSSHGIDDLHSSADAAAGADFSSQTLAMDELFGTEQCAVIASSADRLPCDTRAPVAAAAGGRTADTVEPRVLTGGEAVASPAPGTSTGLDVHQPHHPKTVVPIFGEGTSVTTPGCQLVSPLVDGSRVATQFGHLYGDAKDFNSHNLAKTVELLVDGHSRPQCGEGTSGTTPGTVDSRASPRPVDHCNSHDLANTVERLVDGVSICDNMTSCPAGPIKASEPPAMPCSQQASFFAKHDNAKMSSYSEPPEQQCGRFATATQQYEPLHGEGMFGTISDAAEGSMCLRHLAHLKDFYSHRIANICTTGPLPLHTSPSTTEIDVGISAVSQAPAEAGLVHVLATEASPSASTDGPLPQPTAPELFDALHEIDVSVSDGRRDGIAQDFNSQQLAQTCEPTAGENSSHLPNTRRELEDVVSKLELLLQRLADEHLDIARPIVLEQLQLAKSRLSDFQSEHQLADLD